MLITVKTLFYSANAYDNGFLNVFSTGNLLNSHTLWQSRVCAKEWKRTVYMSTQTFSAQFTAKDIYFLHFSSVSCQKHIKMNVEWMRMAIPVLILMPVDQYNDKPVPVQRPTTNQRQTWLSPNSTTQAWFTDGTIVAFLATVGIEPTMTLCLQWGHVNHLTKSPDH